jgi:hypothetical protein
MNMNPPRTDDHPFTHIVGEVALALGERPNDTAGQRDARIRQLAGTIMAFRPGDPIEAMIAGHCVMFHELIVDSVRGTVSGADTSPRQQQRNSIVAMDKAFGNNFARLTEYRAEVVADANESPAAAEVACAETDIAERMRRHAMPLSGDTAPAPARTPSVRPDVARQTGPEMPASDPARLGTIMNPLVEGAMPVASGSRSGEPDGGTWSQPGTQAYAGNRQARRLAARHGQARSGG